MTSQSAITPSVPRLIPILNPVIRRLLGVGLPFGPNVLLTVRGRTSGLPRTFPVALIEIDDRRYVQSPFGEVNWVRNLRVAGRAVVSKGGRDEEVEVSELPPENAAIVLRRLLTPYLRSRLGAFVVRRFLPLSLGSASEEYLALAQHHPMFELRVRGEPVGAISRPVPASGGGS